MKAIVEIHREGWKSPFMHEVYLDEYAQDNQMWADKPRTMLKKVATAQAFRLCFPDEMGGMPYTSDELPDNMVRNVTPEGQQESSETETVETVQAVAVESNPEWAHWKADKYPSVRDGITESMKVLGLPKDAIKAIGRQMQEMLDTKDWRSLEELQAGLYERVINTEIEAETKEELF
jgi:hypothetical protein